MTYAMFIDTTLCTGCRGCQVACKQWHDMPAEDTRNNGSYQNPADLSFATYKLVRMSEEVVDGRLHWLFFPDQCRHCIDPPCLEVADDAGAVYRDPATGAVLYTLRTRELGADDVIESCPYNIPRKAADDTLAKCDFCNDRIHNGEVPACVKTCPTGAMNFGPLEEMRALARFRLEAVKNRWPSALLADADEVRVIYLLAVEPGLYHGNAVATAGARGLTRQAAFRKMLRPFTKALDQLA
jgi:formate dehydrogenase iron-sulfur subunit